MGKLDHEPRSNQQNLNTDPSSPDTLQDLYDSEPHKRSLWERVKLWAKQNPKKAMGAAAAGIVFTAGAAGGVVRATGDSAPTERTDVQQEPTAQTVDTNPDAAPTEEPTIDTSSEPEIIDDAYVETVTRDPSDKVIEYSLQPVNVEFYNPDEAAIRLMNDLKILWLSGTPDLDSNERLAETIESIKLREKQLNVLIGSEKERNSDDTQLPVEEWIIGNRGALAGYLYAVTVDFGGYEEDGQFNSTAKILKTIDESNDTATYRIRNTWTSNIGELEIGYETDIVQPLRVVDRTVTIRNIDGEWKLWSITDNSLVEEENVVWE